MPSNESTIFDQIKIDVIQHYDNTLTSNLGLAIGIFFSFMACGLWFIYASRKMKEDQHGYHSEKDFKDETSSRRMTSGIESLESGTVPAREYLKAIAKTLV